MLLASAIAEVILGSLVALPLLIYRFKAKRWNRIPLEYPKETHDSQLVILLPIWNEAVVIEKKLDEQLPKATTTTSGSGPGPGGGSGYVLDRVSGPWPLWGGTMFIWDL